MVASVAVGVGGLHRAEDGVNHYASRGICGEARGFIHHGVRSAINLRGFIDPQEINSATQQRRQLCQLPYISQLEQEVLVHQQLVGSV